MKRIYKFKAVTIKPKVIIVEDVGDRIEELIYPRKGALELSKHLKQCKPADQ